jgi:hypothetical protein
MFSRVLFFFVCSTSSSLVCSTAEGPWGCGQTSDSRGNDIHLGRHPPTAVPPSRPAVGRRMTPDTCCTQWSVIWPHPAVGLLHAVERPLLLHACRCCTQWSVLVSGAVERAECIGASPPAARSGASPLGSGAGEQWSQWSRGAVEPPAVKPWEWSRGVEPGSGAGAGEPTAAYGAGEPTEPDERSPTSPPPFPSSE